MNKIEIACLSASFLITVLHLRRMRFPHAQSMLSAAIVLPAAALAMRSATEFLTTDELYVILEPIALGQSDLQQWRYGLMHTTTALLAAPLGFLSQTVGITGPALKGIAKGLHVMSGYLLFLAIHGAAARLFAPTRNRALFFVIFFCTLLLLPMNLVALRVFNYDLLALGFGILSYFVLADAWLRRDLKGCRTSILFAALAAQEKISASPFLLLAIIAYTVLASRSGSLPSIAIRSLKANLIACAVFLGTGLVAVLSGAQEHLVFSVRLLFYPLVGWALPIVSSFSLGSAVEHYPLWALGLQLGVPGAVAWGMERLKGRIRRIEWHSTVSYAAIFAAAAIAALGIYGTFVMKAYWAPMAPIAPGNFVPANSFNGLIMHFEAASAVTHKVSTLIWSLSVFLNAVPTLIWAGVAILFFLPRSGKPSRTIAVFLRITLLGALALPFAFGLSSAPVGNKYLQIPICLLACVAAVAFFHWLSGMDPRKRVVAGAAMIGCLIFEIIPFAPLYAAFRPIWINYDQDYNSTPIVGRLNPSWIGWGEEAMIAGKLIQDACEKGAIRCDDVRIYCSYPGDWIFPGRRIDMRCAAPWAEQSLRFTDQDYYVLNRSKIVQGGFFPRDFKPFLTIEFRGFVQGWIFRGDQVRDSGLHLN